jgi:endonuclease/exonuclease/phosphatase family metal-dependent hydrolase
VSAIGKSIGGGLVVFFAIISVFLAAIIGAALVLFSILSDVAAQANAEACDGTKTGQNVDLSPAPGHVSIDGSPLTREQFRNARIILSVVDRARLSERAGVIALITALTESRLVNVPFGDRDSLGLFQQRDPWGTAQQRMNPALSTTMFLFGGHGGQPGLTDTEGWQTRPMGEVAQDVQVSAFPDRYEGYIDEAEQILAAYKLSTVTAFVVPTKVENCSDFGDRIDAAIAAALSRKGESYSWDDSSGAGLVSWAFSGADIALPPSLEGLATFGGDKSKGVSAKLYSGENMTDSSSLRRGDIVFWSSDQDAAPEHVGIELGPGTDLRIASFNIRKSSKDSDWENRLRRSTKVLLENHVDVAGLQELKSDQHKLFLHDNFGGARYDMYPATFKGKSQDYVSENSIIWDQERFSLVEGTELPFRFYAGDIRKYPQVKLQDKVTGQQFYVLNTHDPAGPATEKARYENAKSYQEHLKTLSGEGLPVFFTGDFNSGYKNRTHNNTTYLNDRENLTYCVLTSGESQQVVWDAYDAAANRSGQCPSEGNANSVDHVYVSKSVQVSKYFKIRRGFTHNGSDVHDTIIADATLPGRSSKLESSVVTRAGDKVDVDTVDVRKIVSVLRLTVSDVALAAGSGKWSFPLKKGTYHYNSNSYGPGMSGHSFHNGTDFGTSGATPSLYAMHDGEVVRMGWGGAWGNYYVVETGVPVPGVSGATYKYLYSHLSKYASGIRLGDKVTEGQYLGNVGDTGNSSGEHLHLTICTDMICTMGSSVGSRGSVDPIPFLADLGITP